MALLNFNAQTVAPATAFEPLPADWYVVRITASEMKPTKDGQNAYLELEMTVADGPFVNRKVFDRLNLHNSNETAMEIAQRTLSAICHATGVYMVQDSAQLHGIPMQAKVSLRPARSENGKDYEASNEVKGYRYANGNALNNTGAPTASAPVGAPTQPPAAPVVQPAAPAYPATHQQPAAPMAAPVAPPAPVYTAPPAAPVAAQPAPVAYAPPAAAPAAAPVAQPAAPWATQPAMPPAAPVAQPAAPAWGTLPPVDQPPF